MNENRIYQNFVVNSTKDASFIHFEYPYNIDTIRFNYKLIFKSIVMQYSITNITSGDNTVTLNSAPTLPSGSPVTYSIPAPGAYDFEAVKTWWNSQNWYGGKVTLQFNSALNRIGIVLVNGTSITIASGLAKLFGSRQGTISNTTGSEITYVCDFPPQFNTVNTFVLTCNSINAGIYQNVQSPGSVIQNVIATVDLSQANPGQYLSYYQNYVKEEYKLFSPTFDFILLDNNGNKLNLDYLLPTTISFVLALDPNVSN